MSDSTSDKLYQVSEKLDGIETWQLWKTLIENYLQLKKVYFGIVVDDLSEEAKVEAPKVGKDEASSSVPKITVKIEAGGQEQRKRLTEKELLAKNIILQNVSSSVARTVMHFWSPREMWASLVEKYESNTPVDQFSIRTQIENLKLTNMKTAQFDQHVARLRQLFSQLAACGHAESEGTKLFHLYSSMPKDILMKAFIQTLKADGTIKFESACQRIASYIKTNEIERQAAGNKDDGADEAHFISSSSSSSNSNNSWKTVQLQRARFNARRQGNDRNTKSWNNNNNNTSFKGTCFACGGPHMRKDCKNRAKLYCNNCNKQGHLAKACQKQKQQQMDQSGSPNSTDNASAVIENQNEIEHGHAEAVVDVDEAVLTIGEHGNAEEPPVSYEDAIRLHTELEEEEYELEMQEQDEVAYLRSIGRYGRPKPRKQNRNNHQHGHHHGNGHHNKKNNNNLRYVKRQ